MMVKRASEKNALVDDLMGANLSGGDTISIIFVLCSGSFNYQKGSIHMKNIRRI